MRHARRLARLAEAEAGRTYEPILLPAEHAADPPERQIIRAAITLAPGPGPLAERDAAPWSAKHVEHG
jgi:hypothetical protein